MTIALESRDYHRGYYDTVKQDVALHGVPGILMGVSAYDAYPKYLVLVKAVDSARILPQHFEESRSWKWSNEGEFDLWMSDNVQFVGKECVMK